MRDAEALEGGERLGGDEGAEQQAGENLLALAPHLVSAGGGRSADARDPFGVAMRGTHLHSTSTGPWMTLRICSSLIAVDIIGGGVVGREMGAKMRLRRRGGGSARKAWLKLQRAKRPIKITCAPSICRAVT